MSEYDRVSDRAKRAYDIVTNHLLANRQNVGLWVILYLHDGSSDGALYDCRADAVETQRNRSHERGATYLKIPPDGISPRGVQAFLDFSQRVADNGGTMPQPPGEREIVVPNRLELIYGGFR